jgi:hypothetical protein
MISEVRNWRLYIKQRATGIAGIKVRNWRLYKADSHRHRRDKGKKLTPI